MALGVADPRLFARRLALLQHGVYRSMCAQTNQSFRWVVITESHIDKRTRSAIETLFQGMPTFHLCMIDSFARREIKVNYSYLCDRYLGKTHHVILSSIDDDDSVSVDFVDRVQRHFEERDRELVNPAVLSFSKGLVLAPMSNEYRSAVIPYLTCGLTMATPDTTKLHLSATAHFRMGEYIERMGGLSYVLLTKEPVWLKTALPESDSRYRSTKRKPTTTRLKIDTACDTRIERALRRFNLPRNHMKLIRNQLESIVATRPNLWIDVGVEHGTSRLLIKESILRLASLKAEQIARQDSDKDEFDLATLKQLYYLI